MKTSVLFLVAALTLSNCGAILVPVRLTAGAVDVVTRSSATSWRAGELAPKPAH